MTDRKLRVFLCHSSQDKTIVRELYQRLLAEGWIDPWLDEERLLSGMDWDMEIEKTVEATDAVIVFLSNFSVTKEGFVQKELKFVLDIALEKPDGTIFMIPLRLDGAEIPRKLRSWQYVDYSIVANRDWAFKRILRSLRSRYEQKSGNGHDKVAESKAFAKSVESDLENRGYLPNIFSPLLLSIVAVGTFLSSLAIFFATLPIIIIPVVAVFLGGVSLLISILSVAIGYYRFSYKKNSKTTSSFVLAIFVLVFICGSLPIIYLFGDTIAHMLGVY